MFRRGDPQPTGYAWRSMTLEKLQRARAMCRITCEHCGHQSEHSPAWLATMGGAEWGETLYHVVQRCVCGRCGSRHVIIMVANR